MTIRGLAAVVALSFALMLTACGGGSGRYTGTDVTVAATAPTVALVGGDTAIYLMTVSNVGQEDAANVQITNVIGNQLALSAITCTAAGGAACPASPSVAMTIPTLPAGGSLVFEVTATVAQGANGSLTNTMSANITDDSDRSNNTATGTATANGNDLSVIGTAPAGPIVDASVTFTMVITNSGPSGAQNVVISNALSTSLTLASPIECVPTLGAVAPTLQPDSTLLSPSVPVGGVLTCTVHANVAAGTTGPVFTTMTVTAAGDGRTGDNTATASVGATLGNNISVTASAPAGPVVAGASTTFTMVVANTGPATAFDVSLNNVLSANLAQSGAIACAPSGGAVAPALQADGSLLSPSIPVSGVLTCSVPVTVAAGTNGIVFSTLTATAANDERTGDNAATASVSAVSSNLGASQTGAAQVAAGTATVFTAIVANPGPGTANNLVINWTHNAPAGVTFDAPTCVATGGATCPSPLGAAMTLPSLGIGRTLTFTFNVNTSSSSRGSIVNTVTVASDEDQDLSNNTATSTTVAVDGRNGVYQAFGSDGRQYSLTIDFDAGSYTMSGNAQSVQRGFALDAATGDFIVSGNARFRVAQDMISGGHDFGTGVIPFVAARSFATTVNALAGSYDIATLNVPASGSTFTHAATARVSGNVLQLCQSDTSVDLPQNCAPTSLKSYVVSVTGNVFTGIESTTGEVYTFYLARSGASVALLSAGLAPDASQQLLIGLPDSAALSGGTLRGASITGDWVTLTISGTSYAAAGSSTNDGAGLVRINNAAGPFSMLTGQRSSDGARVYVMQASPLAIVVGGFGGSPSASGLLQVALP